MFYLLCYVLLSRFAFAHLAFLVLDSLRFLRCQFAMFSFTVFVREVGFEVQRLMHIVFALMLRSNMSEDLVHDLVGY